MVYINYWYEKQLRERVICSLNLLDLENLFTEGCVF